MPIQLSTNRNVTIAHTTDDDEEFTVTFDFPFAEDINYKKLRSILTKEGEDIAESNMVGNITILFILRTSLVECSNIIDQDGNEIKIKNEDGSINELNQKVVFEYVKGTPELYMKAMMAYIGVKGKNSETGATQQ